MEHAIYLVTLVGAALVVAAAFSSLIAFRFGAPLLLLFLCIGLATGTDGLGIQFDNARLAYFAGSLALAVILFDSGFGTPLNALRQAAGPALSLATIGVLLTTGLFGVVAYYLLDLSWLESFLL
ncbi:MAG: potassium/proton antiporter, partial [Mesorhizobium sp.]